MHGSGGVWVTVGIDGEEMWPHVGSRRTLEREVTGNGEREFDLFTGSRPEENQIVEGDDAWLNLQFARLESQLVQAINEVLRTHLATRPASDRQRR